MMFVYFFFFFSSRRRHTRWNCDWSSDVCSSDLPTDTSSLYTGPINITNTVQVRARSFGPGLLPGPLHSESYILLNANAINFTSNLPVIVIHTLGAGSISASVSKFANMSFYEPENGRTSLTNT